MKARFIRSIWENDSHTIGSFFFKTDKPYYFTPGQYADLTIPHSPYDSRGMTRTMTITSESSDKLVAITTRFAKRRSTYKEALVQLQPGSSVTLSDAMGDMVLPLDASIPLVFVAGGIGIASYISMVRWLNSHTESRDITMLYAVRNSSDIVFQPVLESYASVGKYLGKVFTTDHKIDAAGWTGTVKKARLTGADIIAAMQPEAQVYISGSQTMVESLRTELETTYQVPQYQIVFDYYDGYIET